MNRSSALNTATLSSALATILALLTLHFLPHGRDLNPVHHWLSEYVLSHNSAAIWLMRSSFAVLGLTAWTVGFRATTRVGRFTFGLAGAALVSMIFFESAPNDGKHLAMARPLLPGSIHQLLLYIAIGGALIGMFTETLRFQLRRASLWAAFSMAAIGTAMQTVLVTEAHRTGSMTYFGGLTERLVVVAMLAWVVLYSCGSSQIARNLT